jgi:hypothetical protein
LWRWVKAAEDIVPVGIISPLDALKNEASKNMKTFDISFVL